MRRIWYTLSRALTHRAPLRRYTQDPTKHCQTILSLDLHRLKQQGIKILVFDFDGVLASHGEVTLSAEVDSWLNKCLQLFGSGKVFVLSNKPNTARAHYFATRFTGISFIFPPKKKPYPDGILQILALTGAAPSTVLMIDDRLLTGILAAVLAKTSALWITDPLVSWRKRPVKEFFYFLLRKMERFIV